MSSVWRVCLSASVWAASMSPGSSAFLEVCASDSVRVCPWRDVSSDWSVSVSDWDVEISPGSAAFLDVWVGESVWSVLGEW